VYQHALRTVHEASSRAAALLATAQGAPAREDEYPGERAAASREGRRRRTVDLDGLSAALSAAAAAVEGFGEGEPVEARAGAQPSELLDVAD